MTTNDDAPRTATELIFEHPDGRIVRAEVTEASSVMEYARAAGIARVIGRCGGFATCGTCHLLQVGSTVTPELELDVLTGVGEELSPSSRLSCQVPIAPGDPSQRWLVPD